MKNLGRVAVLILWAALLSGCAGPNSPLVAKACRADISQNRCVAVVAIAQVQLGLHWPITALRRSWDNCGVTRCGPTDDLDQGWVVFEFMFGEPLRVHVRSQRQADGVGFVLVAADPEKVPESGGPPPPEIVQVPIPGR